METATTDDQAPDAEANGSAGGRKNNTATVALRVEAVLSILMDGAQLSDVAEFAAEQGWDVTPRTLQRYIRKADDLLIKRLEKSFDRRFARHIAQLDRLIARAINGGDLSVARAALSDKAKLFDLFPQEKKPDAAPVQFTLNVREVVIDKPAPLENQPHERLVIPAALPEPVANGEAAPCPTSLPPK